MMIYPIIASLIALIAILYLCYIKLFKKSIMFYLFWILIWLFVVIFAFVPELSIDIANIFGISRGLDFLIIVAIIVLFYLVFRLYIKVDKLQEEMTDIVTEIALNNEISAEKDNNKKD